MDSDESGALRSQYVRFEAGDLLLSEGVILIGKETLVEYVSDRTNPPLVEVMKDTGTYACPVMYRHERLQGCPTGRDRPSLLDHTCRM